MISGSASARCHARRCYRISATRAAIPAATAAASTWPDSSTTASPTVEPASTAVTTLTIPDTVSVPCHAPFPQSFGLLDLSVSPCPHR